MRDRPLTRAWWRYHFFKMLGHVLRSPVKSNPEINQNPSRILVIAPVHRGDYLVLSPLFASLVRRFPRASIAVLVSDASIELAVVDPHVRHVIRVRKSLAFGLTLRDVFHYHADLVIYPKGHPSFTETLFLLVARAPQRIGLSHPDHDFFLTHPVKHDWENEHRTITFARLLAPIGIDPTDAKRRLHIGQPAYAEKWAQNLRQTLPEEAILLALNISALSPNRIWNGESWVELIHDLNLVQQNLHFCLMGMPDDHTILEEICSQVPNATVVKTPGMLEAVGVIARCHILVTVDTGIVQAAAARNIPMVVLYNGDHEVYTRFAPVSVPHRGVLAQRGSPVSSISVDEVFHETVHLLVQMKIRPSTDLVATISENH